MLSGIFAIKVGLEITFANGYSYIQKVNIYHPIIGDMLMIFGEFGIMD
jgi:hypothetical protein